MAALALLSTVNFLVILDSQIVILGLPSIGRDVAAAATMTTGLRADFGVAAGFAAVGLVLVIALLRTRRRALVPSP